MRYKRFASTYDRSPEKRVDGHFACSGWQDILATLGSLSDTVIIAEFYPGVNEAEIITQLKKLGGTLFRAEDCMLCEDEYRALIRPYVTDDRVFGVMNTLKLDDLLIPERVKETRARIEETEGLRVVAGTGASLVAQDGIIVYFDMTRWELQCRFRRGASNWHTSNPDEEYLRKYKQGFFVDWRMADRRKRALLDRIDYIVDTVVPDAPNMVCGDGFRAGLERIVREPFRLVPYFAPEVWGGQWMKEVCGLDPDSPNYAWAFDGVPEENSVMLRFGDVRVELPSVDAVFYRPKLLLGDRVHGRFGDEFPIRFDFLDTMQGQNLSLQVHPLTEYIQHTFGMHYTQDESYYILDCAEDAHVCLGLKEGTDPGEMLSALEAAQSGGEPFDADRFVNRWPAKRHDHFLIPAGTIHCSGAGSMVLEISATPYIFTFKLWDWGRLGLDGRPRPVHLGHGRHVIQWDRTTSWVKENLVNAVTVLREEDGFREERTGLHEREFIETRRYTLTESRVFESDGSVSMCNCVEGEGVVVGSVDGSFAPFTAHYAETFIIPACIDRFTLTPAGSDCMVIRATVR